MKRSSNYKTRGEGGGKAENEKKKNFPSPTTGERTDQITIKPKVLQEVIYPFSEASCAYIFSFIFSARHIRPALYEFLRPQLNSMGINTERAQVGYDFVTSRVITNGKKKVT